MNKRIEEALQWFDVVSGEDGFKVSLKDGAPESLLNSIMEAHGERMPSNWIWNTYYDLLSTLGDYTIKNEEELGEASDEAIDSCVDIYTSDLTKWLGEHSANVEYLTEAIGPDYGATDGFQALSIAQYLAVREIYEHVANYITA